MAKNLRMSSPGNFLRMKLLISDSEQFYFISRVFVCNKGISITSNFNFNLAVWDRLCIMCNENSGPLAVVTCFVLLIKVLLDDTLGAAKSIIIELN